MPCAKPVCAIADQLSLEFNALGPESVRTLGTVEQPPTVRRQEIKHQVCPDRHVEKPLDARTGLRDVTQKDIVAAIAVDDANPAELGTPLRAVFFRLRAA